MYIYHLVLPILQLRLRLRKWLARSLRGPSDSNLNSHVLDLIQTLNCPVTEWELGSGRIPRAPSSELTVARSVCRDPIPAEHFVYTQVLSVQAEGPPLKALIQKRKEIAVPCPALHCASFLPSLLVLLLLSTCTASGTDPHSSGITGGNDD